MHRLVLLALALLAIAGCGAVSPGAAVYQRRWQAHAIDHYLLSTRDQIGGQVCDQVVEVRGEQLVQIRNNTCRHPNIWTVGWLFAHIARAGQPAVGCALLDPVAGCVCRNAVSLQVEYDPALSFPREIIVRLAWQANWQSLAYWRATVLHGALPACVTPSNALSYTVVVHDITILP